MQRFFKQFHVEFVSLCYHPFVDESSFDVHRHIIFLILALQLELSFEEGPQRVLQLLLGHKALVEWVQDLLKKVDVLFLGAVVELQKAVQLNVLFPFHFCTWLIHVDTCGSEEDVLAFLVQTLHDRRVFLKHGNRNAEVCHILLVKTVGVLNVRGAQLLTHPVFEICRKHC